MILLAFDFGIKNIGIAVTETKLLYAKPLKSIFVTKNQTYWEKINRILLEWKPHYIIIGYPIDMYGKKQGITKKTEKFKKEFFRRYKIPIFLHDERLSTVESKDIIFKKIGYRGLKKTCIHSIAAKVILEGWMENNLNKI